MGVASAVMADLELSLEDELEALAHTFFEELTIRPKEKSGAQCIDFVLQPATAMDTNQQFLRATVTINIPAGYPDAAPVVNVISSRGLGDDDISALLEVMTAVAIGRKGEPMLFEMLQESQLWLTNYNSAPRGDCSICLSPFRNGPLMRTPCFHHVHIHCFAAYVRAELQRCKDLYEEKKRDGVRPGNLPQIPTDIVSCPVCREGVPFKGYDSQHDEYDRLATEHTANFVYVPNEQILLLQERMAKILNEQRERGAIIDVEKEKNRFFLDSNAQPVYVQIVRESLPSASPEPHAAASEPSISNTNERRRRQRTAEKKGQTTKNGTDRDLKRPANTARRRRNGDQGADTKPHSTPSDISPSHVSSTVHTNSNRVSNSTTQQFNAHDTTQSMPNNPTSTNDPTVQQRKSRHRQNAKRNTTSNAATKKLDVAESS